MVMDMAAMDTREEATEDTTARERPSPRPLLLRRLLRRLWPRLWSWLCWSWLWIWRIRTWLRLWRLWCWIRSGILRKERGRAWSWTRSPWQEEGLWIWIQNQRILLWQEGGRGRGWTPQEQGLWLQVQRLLWSWLWTPCLLRIRGVMRTVSQVLSSDARTNFVIFHLFLKN